MTNPEDKTGSDIAGDGLDTDKQELMHRVGARIRKARVLRAFPRRIISERSGISPRYLAQLEAGEGNISVGLLQRIANALGQRIEWFVGPDDPWGSDMLRLTELYRTAPPGKRQQAIEILSQHSAEEIKAGRICLIGLRGAGKSTLGAMAGSALHVPFLELNAGIEEQVNMPIAEVVALYGQEGYRKLESKALQRIVAEHDRIILAAAGGIVSEPDTFNTLMTYFHTIWIKADPQEHMDRVRGQGDTRPMAGNPEAMEQLRDILKNRESLYERAEVWLNTTGKPVHQSADELIRIIRKRKFLDSGKARRTPL